MLAASAADPGAQLQSRGDEFILTQRDGNRMGFNYLVTSLKWIEDRHGNRLSIYRNGSGLVTLTVSRNMTKHFRQEAILNLLLPTVVVIVVGLALLVLIFCGIPNE